MLENEVIKEALQKKVVTVPARRELVRYLSVRGLSERRSLRIARISASALRYRPQPDRNVELRGEVIRLAHRHKRYGAAMIYLKQRQSGWYVNHKRVERLYAQSGLQVRRRKRKKVPACDRQPLQRPLQANEVWSMDFVFDRTAEGQVIKCLTVVDDGTHEAVAVAPERAISGEVLMRILDRLWLARGLPRIIRTDNGREFCGRILLKWTHRCGVQLRQIQPGRPNQNAYIESPNGRLRDECLNEHRFVSLGHARTIIEAWRQEYNNERPKKALGGLTPIAYARQLSEAKMLPLATGL